MTATAKARKPKPKSLTDQLRSIFTDWGCGPSTIASEAALSHSVVARFLAGADLTTASLDKLAIRYGIRLIVDSPAPRKPKRKKRTKSCKAETRDRPNLSGIPDNEPPRE